MKWGLEPPDGSLINIDKRGGSAFFGIDGKYLVQIQKREIFELVGHGFSKESIDKMSLEERRLYCHFLVEKHNPNHENPPDV